VSPSTISNNNPVHDVETLAAPVTPSPITTMSKITNGNSNSTQQPVLETMVSNTRTPFQATSNGTHLSVPVENEIRSLAALM
jgi:hypothetical protein